MSYFQYLPQIQYRFSNGTYTVRDVFTKAVFNDNFYKSEDLYYVETTDNIQRPDRLSFSKYGSFEFYWLFLLANKIVDINKDWPLLQEDFGNFLKNQSTKKVYYLKESADIVPNDILYSNDSSYGVIESWDPFTRSVLIKENYSLPSDGEFSVRRIDTTSSTGFIELTNYCSSTTFNSYGNLNYLESPHLITKERGKSLHPFVKIDASDEVTETLLLDGCDDQEIEDTLLYKIVNNETINGITIKTKEAFLVEDYFEKTKINIVNPSFISTIQSRIRLLLNDPSATANTIFRIG